MLAGCGKPVTLNLTSTSHRADEFPRILIASMRSSGAVTPLTWDLSPEAPSLKTR